MDGVRAVMTPLEQQLLCALKEITEHHAAVMGGPLVTGQGVRFKDGVEGIPTIVRARAAIAKAEGRLQ